MHSEAWPLSQGHWTNNWGSCSVLLCGAELVGACRDVRLLLPRLRDRQGRGAPAEVPVVGKVPHHVPDDAVRHDDVPGALRRAQLRDLVCQCECYRCASYPRLCATQLRSTVYTMHVVHECRTLPSAALAHAGGVVSRHV